jgi:hypothetical protein
VAPRKKSIIPSLELGSQKEIFGASLFHAYSKSNQHGRSPFIACDFSLRFRGCVRELPLFLLDATTDRPHHHDDTTSYHQF